MHKHTLSLVASATLVASIGANTLTLDPIVISASKTEQSLKDTTANIDVITAEELEEKHITSVIEALRMLANMPISQDGGLGQKSSFFQRGFSSANTVVLIDGIRYNDPTTTNGQAQLEHLMVNDIERIEILNGAQSGVWGANAAAGVVNIITKKSTKTLQASGNLEYGSYATTKIAAAMSQKIDSLSYYIGVNQIKTDGFSAQTPKDENPDDFENDGYKNQTLNLKLGYDLSEHDSIAGQFTYINAATHYDGYNAPDSNYNSTQIHRVGNISYRHTFNDKDALDASYAIATFDREYPQSFTAYKGSNKELNLQSSYHYSEYSFIVAGLNTLDTKDTINAKELDSKGVFLSNTSHFGNLLLNATLRHDTYALFKDKTTGKAGAKYFFTDDVTVSGNYATAYRTPSLYELYAPASTYYGITYLLGNSNLTPETTKGYDLTFQFKALSLSYFYNKIDNLIEFTNGYNNVEGISTFKGYEIRYHDSLNEHMNIDLSYHKLSAKDKNGLYLIRRPQESASASLTYYPTQKLTLGTSINYVGTRPDSDFSTYPATEIQTGRYALMSAHANYDMSSTLTLYVKGENLNNKRYQEVEGYATAGRSFYCGLNAKF